MRKIIILFLFIHILTQANELEKSMDKVDNYLCQYEKYFCNTDISARTIIKLYDEYNLQLVNKKLQTTDGLNLSTEIKDALTDLNLFEYNYFPKVKLSETLISILKFNNINDTLDSLPTKEHDNAVYRGKLPSNIYDIIHNNDTIYYTELKNSEKSLNKIFIDNHFTLKGFINPLTSSGKNLISTTNLAWEISLATFLKAEKYAEKVAKAKNIIEEIGEIKGYVKAVYTFILLVKDLDNLKVENQNNTLKVFGDILEMIADATSSENSSLGKLIIDFELQRRQIFAFYTLLKYYENTNIEGILLISKNEVSHKIMVTMSEIMNKIISVSNIPLLEDASAVTNALIGAVTASESTLYLDKMTPYIYSDKYLEEKIKLLAILNKWQLMQYYKLLPIANFNKDSRNNYYLMKQSNLGVYLAGFNYDDNNRVDKCVKTGDFYKALSYNIQNKIQSDYLHIDEFLEYTNKHANENISIAKAIYFLDKYTYAYFESKGIVSEKRYKLYHLDPLGNKKLLVKRKILYNNWNLNLTAEEKRQFLQVQGTRMGKSSQDFENLNQCLTGYKAINFLDNYAKAINYDVEITKKGN